MSSISSRLAPSAASSGPGTGGTDRARATAVDVTINGERRQTMVATLDALLVEAGYGGAKVATALNGDFVAERQRARTPIEAGDHIEVVAPRQGG